jgi:hypothetical protein
VQDEEQGVNVWVKGERGVIHPVTHEHVLFQHGDMQPEWVTLKEFMFQVELYGIEPACTYELF